MAGSISKQYRERRNRLVLVLGLSLAGSALGIAADKPTDPAAPARVTAVRFWSAGDTTRIAIEVSAEFRFKYERLVNPDRLFFDIFGAKPEMARRGLEVIHVDDAIVKQLRVAETQPGVTRVVIDLKQAAALTTSQLSNPDRLMVEVRLPDGKPTDKSLDKTTKDSSTSSITSAVGVPASGGRVLPEPVAARSTVPQIVEVPTTASNKAPAKASAKASTKTATALVETASVSEVPKPFLSAKASALPKESLSKDNRPKDNRANDASAKQPSAKQPSEKTNAVPEKSESLEASLPPEPVGVEPPASVDDVEEVLPAKRGSVVDRSLTRALGLKLGRVVIDPGHGGNDVGTHGPSGYLEKDLSLDVSRRLAALVRENMGSDVVLTRTDDVYVGLEERTRIANEHKADLFLSIHANSSSYRSAAGVETYILNFTTSKTALDLASRENAGSELAIHDLQDLLQKIALRDKVEESHELAARLQTSLSGLSTKSNDNAKNRGVKKAPFVVLIGANMPSVLAEIGFLTNSTDEALLRKPEHRQKIAEALYKGIASYADTLSQVIARKN